MPLSDQTRIADERLTPRIVALWQALAPLKSVVSFMNTGAHPDDETTAMLAALGFRDGIELSYACSTRGEGGQNDIGTERETALGVLRAAEMERACAVLNMRMYWLSERPDDTIFDFGFSKSGVETLDKWGRERTLARFVDILRTERPDIICPTFLDIPGQHGHHRAMTQAAGLAMDLCADPSFDGSTLPVWQVKKLYLPAWSGAGQSYDDDLPPPPATLKIETDGIDPITGFSFEQIAQHSRAYHRSQAMGRWVSFGQERNWPLHLADSRVAGPDDSLFSGLAKDLRDLGLGEAQDHIDAAIAAFPDFAGVLRHASLALQVLQLAKVAPEIEHKIHRKCLQLDRVIQLAAGVQVRARLSKDVLQPDDRARVTIEKRNGIAEDVAVHLLTPDGWSVKGDEVVLSGANMSDPYPAIWDPYAPALPFVTVSIQTHGVQSQTQHALETPPIVVPHNVVGLAPETELINLSSDRRRVDLKVSGGTSLEGEVSIDVPEGWQAERSAAGFVITAPDDVDEGLYRLPLTLDGAPAQRVAHVAYPHIAPRALAEPAELAVRVLDAALPAVRVGYVGGGHDHVAHWLKRLGFEVDILQDHHLEDGFEEYDSIVIGIFALKFREGLVSAMPRVHDWVKQGGTLLTLYHRPWDNWDADETPPARLEIGQPSLRWRVTDEAAQVRHMSDHSVLSEPNKISEADWAGWQKERGLYFANDWDTTYEPLLEMNDPDEASHRGALLAGDIGQGRHIHCALILHHQMEKLVPGAFRLMANLLASRK